MKSIRDKGERAGIEANGDFSEKEAEGYGDDGPQAILPRQRESTMGVTMLVTFVVTAAALMLMILRVRMRMRVGVRHLIRKQKQMR